MIYSLSRIVLRFERGSITPINRRSRLSELLRYSGGARSSTYVHGGYRTWWSMLSNLRAIPCRGVAPSKGRTGCVTSCHIVSPLGRVIVSAISARQNPIRSLVRSKKWRREVRGFERVLRGNRYSLPDACITDDLSRYRAVVSISRFYYGARNSSRVNNIGNQHRAFRFIATGERVLATSPLSRRCLRSDDEPRDRSAPVKRRGLVKRLVQSCPATVT